MSSVATAKISTKGWFVIPAAMRRKVGMTPGTQVNILRVSNGIFVFPCRQDPIEELYGALSDGPDLVQALLDERRKERQREDG